MHRRWRENGGDADKVHSMFPAGDRKDEEGG
jgi:hypothetical protein